MSRAIQLSVVVGLFLGFTAQAWAEPVDDFLNIARGMASVATAKKGDCDSQAAGIERYTNENKDTLRKIGADVMAAKPTPAQEKGLENIMADFESATADCPDAKLMMLDLFSTLTDGGSAKAEKSAEVEEPVVAEKVEEPVVAEKVKEPVVAEKVKEPVVAEKVEEPVVVEPVVENVKEPVVDKPVVAKVEKVVEAKPEPTVADVKAMCEAYGATVKEYGKDCPVLGKRLQRQFRALNFTLADVPRIGEHRKALVPCKDAVKAMSSCASDQEVKAAQKVLGEL